MSEIRKILLVILLFPIVFWGCIGDVAINDGFKEREVVLNCILDAQNDTAFALLSYSKPIQSTAHFEPIKDAQILLSEEKAKTGEFVWSEKNAAYVLPFSVKPGNTYRIEARIRNNKVWAETTVPKTIDASIEKAVFGVNNYSFRLLLNDNTSDVNHYWVSATGLEGIEGNKSKNIACVLYSNFEYADDFNQAIYQNGNYKFEYEYYMRFTDSGLPKGKTEIIIYPQCIGNPVEIFLLSTDYHLDKYMKSSLLLQRMDLFAREMPVIYAPFPMYSNINGGAGIFGSFNSVSEKFDGK